MKEDPLILALDLATVAGFAIGRPSDPNPRFGSFRCARPQGSLGAVYRGLSGWLRHTLSQEQIELLVFEAPMQQSIMLGRTNATTARVLIGLCAIAEEIAYGAGIDCREAAIADIRRHFIGEHLRSARAKAATIEACRRIGWNPKNDNEADALALWNYQCSWFDPRLAIRTSPLFRKKIA